MSPVHRRAAFACPLALLVGLGLFVAGCGDVDDSEPTASLHA